MCLVRRHAVEALLPEMADALQSGADMACIALMHRRQRTAEAFGSAGVGPDEHGSASAPGASFRLRRPRSARRTDSDRAHNPRRRKGLGPAVAAIRRRVGGVLGRRRVPAVA